MVLNGTVCDGVVWYDTVWYCIVLYKYHTTLVQYFTIQFLIRYRTAIDVFSRRNSYQSEKREPPPADTQKMKLVCIIRYHTLAMVWYCMVPYNTIVSYIIDDPCSYHATHKKAYHLSFLTNPDNRKFPTFQ